MAPQLILPSLEVTVQLLRRPVLPTERVKVCRVKVAVTDRAALIVTPQLVPETVSQPLQPLNVDPPAALAVRVTVVPLV